ncbi:hypothetical protein ES708_10268 [subsurface metagenome]
MLNDKEIEKIKGEVELEFPNDPAMQQVHIARKIIAKKAKKKGLTYLEYIKQISENLELVHND